MQKHKISDIVFRRAKQSLLDYLAVTSVGMMFQIKKIKEYIRFSEPGKGNFMVVGAGERLALKEAVFLNGLNSHSLDFDDGTNLGIIYLGSPIFSLLLSLAQRYDVKIEDRYTHVC